MKLIVIFVTGAVIGAAAGAVFGAKIGFLEAFARALWHGLIDERRMDEAAALLLIKPSEENKADSVRLTMEQLNQLRHC